MVKRIALVAWLLLAAFLSGATQAAPIHDACSRGDVAAVRQLLRRNPHLANLSDWRYAPPLFQTHSAEIVQLLLANGADPRAINDRGATTLYFKDGAAVRLLLKAGADPRRKAPAAKVLANLVYPTPLFYARDGEAVRLLLKAGTDPAATVPAGSTFPQYTGQTALFGAADAQAVHLLLAAGLSVNTTLPGGETPLYFARTPDVANALLDAGADVNAGAPRNSPLLALATTYDRETKQSASGLANRDQRFETMQTLLRRGLKAQLFAGKALLEALHDGAEPRLIQFLLEAGADPNETLPGFGTANRPITACIERAQVFPDRPEIVHLLVAHGADLHGPGAYRALLVDIDPHDPHRGTRYLLSTDHALLFHCADLHPVFRTPADRDRAAIDLAKIAGILLDAGLDANEKSTFTDATPLHLAALRGNRAVAAVLLAHGADINARTREHIWTGPLKKDAAGNSVPSLMASIRGERTPLGWAIEGGQTEMADWLRKRGGHE